VAVVADMVVDMAAAAADMIVVAVGIAAAAVVRVVAAADMIVVAVGIAVTVVVRVVLVAVAVGIAAAAVVRVAAAAVRIAAAVDGCPSRIAYKIPARHVTELRNWSNMRRCFPYCFVRSFLRLPVL